MCMMFLKYSKIILIIIITSLAQICYRIFQTHVSHCSNRYTLQTVRIDWHSFLSRVGIVVRPSNCFYRRKTLSWKPSSRASVQLNGPAINLNGGNCGHAWSPTTYRNGDNMNGDKCGHSGDRLSQTVKKKTSQNGNNEEVYTFAARKIWFTKYYVC